MKKISLFIIFLIFAQIALAKEAPKRAPLETRQENYIDIDFINLNEKELEKFNRINSMEYNILRPISLKLEANLLREDELNNIKCKWYQRQCKKEVKKNKAFIEGDIKELKRQIWQKKEYFKVLYINETTRKQHLELREAIKNITKNKPQLW